MPDANGAAPLGRPPGPPPEGHQHQHQHQQDDVVASTSATPSSPMDGSADGRMVFDDALLPVEQPQAPEAAVKEIEAEAQEILRLTSLACFYLSPYLTCGECNSLAFIDSRALELALVRMAEIEKEEGEGEERGAERGKDKTDGDGTKVAEPEPQAGPQGGADKNGTKALSEAAMDRLFGLRVEALPRCPGCRRTHMWKVGALNLTNRIAGNKREARRLRRLQHRKITKIQAVARGIRDRARARQLKREKEEHEAWLAYNATLIQCVGRGRLDRRAAQVERSLRRIDGTHPIVMSEALRPWKGVKVFWYKRAAELKLLHRNYQLLVERMGNDPPRLRVERNINLIAHRIHLLECNRAALIQKRVRGMIGRKFIRQYRAERAFLLNRRLVAVFKLQRLYRGWKARRVRHGLEAAKKSAQIVEAFRAERAAHKKRKEQDRHKARLLAAYQHEVRTDRVGKLMSRSYKRLSPVARSRATVARGTALNRWQVCEGDKRLADEARQDTRHRFVEDRVRADPGLKSYFRAELEAFHALRARRAARRDRRSASPRAAGAAPAALPTL